MVAITLLSFINDVFTSNLIVFDSFMTHQNTSSSNKNHLIIRLGTHWCYFPIEMNIGDCKNWSIE